MGISVDAKPGKPKAPFSGGTTEHSLERPAVARISASELLAQLHCSEQGLSEQEATEQRSQYGANTLTRERMTALRILGRQFQSSLIYVLALAAVLAFAIGDRSDGTIIAAIVLINAGLGFSQEYRSERAVAQLSHLISTKILVKRNGAFALRDVTELVPGDIVTLKEGNIVPADIKIISADNVECDQSQLTGESLPVAKLAWVDPKSDGDATLLFAGSTMDQGKATGVVYAIGNDTELGKIAALSTSIHKVTQYEQSLQSFSVLLIKIIGAALAVTLALKVAITRDTAHLPELVIFVIALAVAVVPEALPVIATLTLARGALQLTKQQVVVKRLSALEDLGNITLLCTDKTGTLTENRLTIQRLVSSDEQLFKTLAYAAIDRTSTEQQGTQSAFDAAFSAAIPEESQREAASLALVTEVPFDPATRRRRVLLVGRATGTRHLVVIGAVETLLDIAHCHDEARYREQITAEGQQGLRHLAIAYRQLAPSDGTDLLAQERDLTFLGFVSLADPLRASTPQTLATAERLGVAIKILTGDSKEVAEHVARQVGLIHEGEPVYTGEELARLSSTEFAQAVSRTNVFARVAPEQKFAIIKALKVHDVVGYQGDGINDAPALKLADVAIAVDSATDVAKANADIILLNKDLGVIINAIESGRAIFANINKYITYTMVGNFGNFIALSILYLLATDLPLLARQVLLISLLTDLPLVAISTDTVSSNELEQPKRYNARTLLSISLVLGTLTALFELVFFLMMCGQSPIESETSLYLFLTFTQLIVIASVRNRDHFWKARAPSRLLMGAMGLTAVIGLAIPYIPPLARLFAFSPLPASAVGVIVAMTVLYLLVLDGVKVRYYQWD